MVSLEAARIISLRPPEKALLSRRSLEANSTDSMHVHYVESRWVMPVGRRGHAGGHVGVTQAGDQQRRAGQPRSGVWATRVCTDWLVAPGPAPGSALTLSPAWLSVLEAWSGQGCMGCEAARCTPTCGGPGCPPPPGAEKLEGTQFFHPQVSAAPPSPGRAVGHRRMREFPQWKMAEERASPPRAGVQVL